MIFLISDTHFRHNKIIDYCYRPFKDIEEMNNMIVKNWNEVVTKDDVVFHLGDFSFNGRENVNNYLRILNGKKVFLKGNHDVGYYGECHTALLLNYGGFDFVLTHDFTKVHICKDCWTIHGHLHHRAKYIDTKNKRINVSVEVINYTPISIDKIVYDVKTMVSLTVCDKA